jgi:hypothetical protein
MKLNLMIINLIILTTSLNSQNYFATKLDENTFVSTCIDDSYQVRIPENITELLVKKLNIGEGHIQFECAFNIFYNQNYDIYVIKTKEVTTKYYSIVLFNKKNKNTHLLKDEVYANHMENNESGFSEENRLINENLLEIKDIDNDNKNEILIRERMHNGTAVNTVNLNYYKIINNELNKLFTIEESTLIPMTENTILRRKLDGDKIFVSDEKNRLIGKYTIDLENGEITDIKIYDYQYERFIIGIYRK